MNCSSLVPIRSVFRQKSVRRSNQHFELISAIFVSVHSQELQEDSFFFLFLELRNAYDITECTYHAFCSHLTRMHFIVRYMLYLSILYFYFSFVINLNRTEPNQIKTKSWHFLYIIFQFLLSFDIHFYIEPSKLHI